MITVFGLWHLGCVTAACCAEHFQTIGLDLDGERIDQLRNAKAPLLEPGLDDLLQRGIASGNLTFSDDPAGALADTRLLWLTFDTPVDEEDRADVDWVMDQFRSVLPHLNPGTVVLISSQVPITTSRTLEAECADYALQFAYSPENLRLGNALDVFTNPDRIVVGVRHEESKPLLAEVLGKFSDNILWMSVESAEMTKHAINSFLAVSVTFANELARLCEKTGANAHEVAAGLKSESRIGPGAYVSPGGAFAGGTLARDVQFLRDLGVAHAESLSVIPAILDSNEEHKAWALNRLRHTLGDLAGKRVGVLGLTYKPGTSTLRRSSAMELVRSLRDSDAQVAAYDPGVTADDPQLDGLVLHAEVKSVFTQADAVVVMTAWEDFLRLDWSALIPLMKERLILDQDRFCQSVIDGTDLQARYYSVGVS